MSGQFSASLPFDELPEQISGTAAPDPRKARPTADWLSISNTGADRPALETTPAAPASRRWSKSGLPVGILAHLACITFVGTVIIVVFFGIAFSMLGQTAKQTVANSSARDRQMARVGAGPDRPQSDCTLPAFTTATETPPVMTALAASEPGSTQTPAARTQSGQRSGTATETPVRPPEASRAPSTEQNGQYSRLKQPGNASTEIVDGTVTKAVDAATWVIGDQTVNLWGIRPGPSNLSSSLVGFVDQVRAKGAVECRRQTRSNRYRCLMATGEDVAEAALLAGIGRAAEGATVAYRSAEAQAHQKNKGLWAKP
jgi:hypothetical protein